MSTTIKVIAALAVVLALVWYFRRAQAQSAILNAAGAQPVAPPSDPGAGT